jgi:catechol 2,3-dioxygenase-like lactoylglutathione lyase family enzyme
MLADARVEATAPVSDLARARRFYGETLGLREGGAHANGVDAVFECGGGTRLFLYERAGPGAFPPPPHTVAHFQVDDLAASVAELRDAGVAVEEYEDVAGFAWFKDPDGNVLGIHT